MDKFSKLKPKDIFKEDKNEKVLFQDNILKVIKFEDWSIIKERDVVVCIPYLIETNQIILRHEYIPTYKYVDGQEYYIALVGGGIELGEDPDVAITRELEEEAGIVLREDYKFEKMKPLFMNKGICDKVHPYILPLTERDYHEIVPPTDGSKIESISKSVKVDAKYIDSLNVSDMITDYMLIKMKEYIKSYTTV